MPSPTHPSALRKFAVLPGLGHSLIEGKDLVRNSVCWVVPMSVSGDVSNHAQRSASSPDSTQDSSRMAFTVQSPGPFREPSELLGSCAKFKEPL